MKQKYFCLVVQFLLISAICAIPVNAQDSGAALQGILQAVQKDMDFLKEKMVDVISREDITIEEYNERGRLTKTTDMVSNYRVFPEIANKLSDCNIVNEILESLLPTGILREEREMLSAKENNREQRMERFKFNEHFWASGSSYVGLLILFDKQNENCFDYELRGVGNIKERNVYAIEINQKNVDVGKKASGKNETTSWNTKYHGVALIDAGTMEIVQFNRDRVDINYSGIRNGYISLPIPSSDSLPTRKVYVDRYASFTEYEYDKVKINDQYLTLPVAKTVRLFRENGQPDTIYKYRYSGHKAFNVATKITFGAIEESLDEKGD